MSDSSDDSTRFSLSRWSRRKHEVARARTTPEAPPPAASIPVAAPAVVAPAPAPAAPLPPVESLTIESDFSQFLAPKVDETIKRAALRKLFSDPHFNVMDGLDTYVGDYTQPDPMPEGMLAKLEDIYETLTKDEDKTAAVDEQVADAAPAAAPEAPPPPLAADTKDSTST
jgi:hypothetical protein